MASSYENALVALRTQANNEIDRRGGRSAAPSWASILDDVDAQLSALRAGRPLPPATTNSVKNTIAANSSVVAQYNQKIAAATTPAAPPATQPAPSPVSNLAAAAASAAPTAPSVPVAPAAPSAAEDENFSTEGKSEQELMEMRDRTELAIRNKGGKEAAPNYANRLNQINEALSAMRKAAGVTGPPTDNRPPLTQSTPAPTTTSTTSTLADAAASAGNTAKDEGFSTEGKSEQELMEMRKRTEEEIDKKGGKQNAPNYASRLDQIDKALSTIRKDAGVKGPPTDDRPAITGTTPGDTGTPSNTGGISTTGTNIGASPLIPDDITGAVDSTSGAVNLGKAADVIEKTKAQDINTQFKLDQPIRMTDQFGNVRVISRDPNTGEVTISDTAGGTSSKFKDLAEAAASNWNPQAGRAAAEEAAYGTITKFYDRDKERELEASKQELANRGIPYNPAEAVNPNTKDLYGRTIGGIDQKYQSLKDDAARQAILAGNQSFATNTAAQQAFLNAAMQGATQFAGSWQPYQNKVDASLTDETLDLVKLSADAYLAKYGIDKDVAIKKKQIALQGSGGSGGSSGGSSGGGFEIYY